jgi:hypothetical protein
MWVTNFHNSQATLAIRNNFVNVQSLAWTRSHLQNSEAVSITYADQSVKLSHYRPEEAFRDPGGCQPYAPSVFTPRKDSWYSFLLKAESTPGPLCGQTDQVIENFSDLIGNRTRDLQDQSVRIRNVNINLGDFRFSQRCCWRLRYSRTFRCVVG